MICIEGTAFSRCQKSGNTPHKAKAEIAASRPRQSTGGTGVIDSAASVGASFSLA